MCGVAWLGAAWVWAVVLGVLAAVVGVYLLLGGGGVRLDVDAAFYAGSLRVVLVVENVVPVDAALEYVEVGGMAFGLDGAVRVGERRVVCIWDVEPASGGRLVAGGREFRFAIRDGLGWGPEGCDISTGRARVEVVSAEVRGGRLRLRLLRWGPLGVGISRVEVAGAAVDVECIPDPASNVASVELLVDCVGAVSADLPPGVMVNGMLALSDGRYIPFMAPVMPE